MIRTAGLSHHSHAGLHPDLSGFSHKEDGIWVWGITGEQEWTPDTKTGDHCGYRHNVTSFKSDI